jgi:hypothetical protein
MSWNPIEHHTHTSRFFDSVNGPRLFPAGVRPPSVPRPRPRRRAAGMGWQGATGEHQPEPVAGGRGGAAAEQRRAARFPRQVWFVPAHAASPAHRLTLPHRPAGSHCLTGPPAHAASPARRLTGPRTAGRLPRASRRRTASTLPAPQPTPPRTSPPRAPPGRPAARYALSASPRGPAGRRRGLGRGAREATSGHARRRAGAGACWRGTGRDVGRDGRAGRRGRGWRRRRRGEESTGIR